MPKFLSSTEHNGDIIDINNNSGTAGQILSSLGPGNGIDWIENISTATSAEKVSLEVRFEEAVSKGDPVYVSGFHGSNGPVKVSKARSDDSDKMPAFGLADDDYAQNAEGHAVSLGNLDDIDTSSYSISDTLYVAPTGGLTNTKPTYSNLIQNVGTVSRSNQNNGSIEVTATGRSNDVPNLTTGKIWVGDGNTTESTVVHLDEVYGRMGIGTTSPQALLDVGGGDGTPAGTQFRAVIKGTGTRTLYLDSDGSSSSLWWGAGNVPHFAIDSQSGGGASFWTYSGGWNRRMDITAAGNVGIGTTSPSAKLEVASTGQVLKLGNSNYQDQYLQFRNQSGGFDFGLKTGVGSNGSAVIKTGDLKGFGVATGETNTAFGNLVDADMDFFITPSGNVGISTTSPSAKLHVNSSDATTVQRIQGATNSALEFYNSSTKTGAILVNSTQFLIAADNSNYLNINTGGSERMRITSGGNVGIGTTSPSEKLNVSGNILATGTILGSNLSGTNTGDQDLSGYALTGHNHDDRYYTETESDSRFVNVTGDTMSGSLDVNADIQANTFSQAATGIPRNNLGSPTVTEMALFEPQFTCKTDLSNAYDNLADLTFWVQATDVSPWTEITSYSDDQKRRFLRTNNSSVVIPNLSYKFRVEFHAQNYTFANAIYFYWSSNSHNSQVHIWKKRCSDGAWIQHTNSSTVVSSWPGHLWLPFSSIPWLENNTTNTGHYSDIRVEFTPNWSGHATYGSYNINLSGGQIWGGYPAGRRTPHYYDQNGKLSTWGDFDVNGTAIIDGNVGIGATIPTYKLDVAGSAGSTARFKGSGGQATVSINDGTNDNYIVALSGEFQFRPSGTTVLTTKSNGNVGIGTTSPAAKLTIKGSDSLNAFKITDSGDGDGFKVTSHTTQGTYAQIYNAAHTQTIMLDGRSDSTARHSYFNGGGNVGIGTTSPSNRLEIVGPYSSTPLKVLRHGDYGNVINLGRNGVSETANIGYPADATLNFSTSGSERMRIDSAGNVGIGTTSPNSKLQVVGKATSTSTVSTDAATTLVTKDYVDSSAGNPSHFRQGHKSHNLTNAFTTCLTVNLSNHTSCYVTVCCFGDWGSHSAAAYRGEFFLQNGANSYNEPGIILRQDDNTSNSGDQIVCQILDPTSTANPKNFEIQIKTTATTGTTGFTGLLTFTVQGQFNSVT